MARRSSKLSVLLDEIRACRVCDLPLGPRPIVAASVTARVLLAGQAPGAKVHATGIAWNDASGDRLRDWLGLDRDTFYDPDRIAIVPMGFCYPGKNRSGDLPPRPECAKHWHGKLLPQLSNIQIRLLIGAHAQAYHLGARQKSTLTETVQAFPEYLPQICVLPHPSPRNQPWLTRNPWFERDCLPRVRAAIAKALA